MTAHRNVRNGPVMTGTGGKRTLDLERLAIGGY